MPRRPPFSPPAVVMYGAGISTTPIIPRDRDPGQEALLRLLREGLNPSVVTTVTTVVAEARAALCASCGVHVAVRKEGEVAVALIGTPPDPAGVTVARWCNSCARVLLDKLMEAGLIGHASKAVEGLLDRVTHPYCSLHGALRPCAKCEEE